MRTFYLFEDPERGSILTWRLPDQSFIALNELPIRKIPTLTMVCGEIVRVPCKFKGGA